MENIEDNLKSFRLHKRRQEQYLRFKDNIKGFLMLGVKSNNENDKTIVNIHEAEECNQKPVSSSFYNDQDEEYDCVVLAKEEIVAADVDPESAILKYTLRTVYFAFWLTLYIIAIELQFGIVFLMFSALTGIYLNTRTGPKKQNEISAYSVFNKNCESIDGTLKAEQFEREIGIR